MRRFAQIYRVTIATMYFKWAIACSYSHYQENVCRITVGGGEAGGAFAPPIWFKTSKIRANSLFIWAHHWQKIVSVSVKTFFFFENTSIWAEKTVSILTEKLNASSHFSGKSLVPPPNHFELLRPWFAVSL